MRRAGLTPIVAMIIVLFMTVAISGTAYVWFTSVLESQQAAVDREIRTSVGLRDVRCAGDAVTVAVMNTEERQLTGRNFSVFVYNHDGELVAEGTHRLSDVDFTNPGNFDTATVTLDTALPKREYTVEFEAPSTRAQGSCQVTQLIRTTCPTSGNVTILQDCQYAPGNYTLGNLTISPSATVHFVSDVSCSDADCSLPSEGRKTLLVTEREMEILGGITADSDVSVGPSRPIPAPVMLMGNTSVSMTGALVEPGS